jgi:hypothetical protein
VALVNKADDAQRDVATDTAEVVVVVAPERWRRRCHHVVVVFLLHDGIPRGCVDLGEAVGSWESDDGEMYVEQFGQAAQLDVVSPTAIAANRLDSRQQARARQIASPSA